MTNHSVQRLLNALAFANIGNYGAFIRLSAKMDAPPAPAAAPRPTATRWTAALPRAAAYLGSH
ncbi:hypothetical protein [uncultured Thiodictyon sp.]|uniref:hypothetical protein n=1 Tax=uncultured Thiodictyon sp. TaxID=1846217 RepID=UPI0025E7D886|nr:hypothetical protein [uncultured Thiodictyon sp.]